MLNDVLDAAARGWHAFPLGRRSKVPTVRAWADVATVDADRIEQWWLRHPDDNYGIACGPSRLVVLDIDAKGDVDGYASIAAIIGAPVDGSRCGHPWPTTVEVVTPTGGRHLYFVDEDGEYRNSAGRLGPGLDVRAVGGFVVGPGSETDLGRYVIEEDGPVDRPSSWLRALRTRPEAVPASFDPRRENARFSTPSGYSASGLIATVATAAEGERNSRLCWAAHRVGLDVRAGKADNAGAAEALDLLDLAARRAGLGEVEVEATIRSGFVAGLEGRGAP